MIKEIQKKTRFWIITILCVTVVIGIDLFTWFNRDNNILCLIILAYTSSYGIGICGTRVSSWLYKKFNITDK